MRKINRMERKTLFWRAAGIWMAGWIPLSGVAAEEMAAVSLDINIDYGNDPFYTEIWFLILIAVLLLFLLVQLIRGGRRSKRKRKALKALKKALKESEESGISKEKSKISEVSVENETDHTGEED